MISPGIFMIYPSMKVYMYISMFESLVYVLGGGGVEIRDIKMPDSSARPPVHILSRPMLLYVKVFVRKFVLVYVCKSISVYALIIKLLLIIKL